MRIETYASYSLANNTTTAEDANLSRLSQSAIETGKFFAGFSLNPSWRQEHQQRQLGQQQQQHPLRLEHRELEDLLTDRYLQAIT